MVEPILSSEICIHFWIIEVHIIFLDHVWRWRFSRSITFDSGLEILEFHNITSKGTSFIRKYIFNLSELLV